MKLYLLCPGWCISYARIFDRKVSQDRGEEERLARIHLQHREGHSKAKQLLRAGCVSTCVQLILPYAENSVPLRFQIEDAARSLNLSSEIACKDGVTAVFTCQSE